MRQPAPWLAGLLAAGLGSMACVVLLANGLGVSPDDLVALLPKAATMPVALGLAGQGGANVHLTTLSVVMTGLAGALWIPWILRSCGVQPGPVHAFTLGACAHAIGLVRVQADSPRWQHFAIAGMCGNALLTALLMGLWWRL
jgi:putative effector of murein hydrolase